MSFRIDFLVFHCTSKSNQMVQIKLIEIGPILMLGDYLFWLFINWERFLKSFCFYCLKERRNKYQFICCDGCPLNLYCSFECRDLDSEKHKLECGYSRLLNSAGISYLVYKLLTKRRRKGEIL